MLDLLLTFLVVVCEIYLVVWFVSFVLGLLNTGWRWRLYPAGAGLPGSVGSFILALAVVIVLGGRYGYHGGL